MTRVLPAGLTLFLAAVSDGAGPAASQTPPIERLDAPAATLAEPFTMIHGFRELSDGRVLITDMLETRVRLIDMARGTSTDIGRRGAGPGEYERPNALYAAAGDTTLLLDLRGRRLMTIDGEGRFTGAETPLRMISGGFKPPRGIDARGRVYLDLAGILAPGLERGALLGRVGLLRFDPATGALDTVAELRVPPMATPSGAGMRPVAPWQPQDAWAVDRSGHVAIIRHDPYRIDWIQPGRPPAAGPTMEYEPVPIGRAEREVWLDRMAAGPGMTVTRNGQRQTVRPPRPSASDLDWPEVMPPFDGPALLGPDGHVWIRRNRPAAETRPLYDVFDRAGRRIHRIELPPGRRVVGLGNGTVYAVREDDDGLLWLERYVR